LVEFEPHPDGQRSTHPRTLLEVERLADKRARQVKGGKALSAQLATGKAKPEPIVVGDSEDDENAILVSRPHHLCEHCENVFLESFTASDYGESATISGNSRWRAVLGASHREHFVRCCAGTRLAYCPACRA
jgi:hypothetical protein